MLCPFAASETVETCEPHEHDTMRVAAEFLCLHGDVDSAAERAQMRDEQIGCASVHTSSQRRWIVKKVYLDREGVITVDRWSVRYYVDYTCSPGECPVMVLLTDTLQRVMNAAARVVS